MKKLSSDLKKHLLLTIVLAIMFAVFTLLVSLADVQPIGPLDSRVGFSTVNNFFFEAFGTNRTLERIADLLGIFVILVGCCFAVFGLYQWISRRSLFKVDPELFVCGTCYILLGVLYVFFNKVPLNYRPILEDGKLAASYPSSHTLLILTVMGSAVLMANRYLRSRPALHHAAVALAALVAITAFFCRLFSGVHWYTDIIGGLLLSATLISALDIAFTAIAEHRALSAAPKE